MLVHWHFTKNEVLKVNVNQIRRFFCGFWSHLLKKYLMEDFIFLCSVEGCSQVSQIRSKNRSYKEKKYHRGNLFEKIENRVKTRKE